MISGAYFAAKYFNDPEITALANSIGTTPNYDLIFDGDNGNRMYMARVKFCLFIKLRAEMIP